MKLAIVGSRSITSRDDVFPEIDEFIKDNVAPDASIVIVSGGAKGVDSMAYDYAKENGYDFVLFKPYHMIDRQAQYIPRYFFTRNKQIVDNSDAILAIWDGQSSGTEHLIKYATKVKKPLTVIKYA